MSLSFARLRWGLLCGAALLCCPFAARAEDAEATIRLKHIKPSVFVRLFLPVTPGQSDSPYNTPIRGLNAVEPDDAASRVTVRGEEGSVERVKKLAKLADVPTPKIRLVARVLRYPDASGKNPEIIARAVGETKTGEYCELKAQGGDHLFLLRFRPQLARSGSITLTSEVSMTAPLAYYAPKEASQQTQRLVGTKLLRPGKPDAVLALTGELLPNSTAENRSLYVEVTPTVVK